MARGLIEYYAARIYGFHHPIVRNGKRYASIVVRLFNGRADARYGIEGPVIAIELHVPDYRAAVRDGVIHVDKESGRLQLTLWKLGPHELKRLARRLEEVAEAVEKAWQMGYAPRDVEEAWLSLRRGEARGRAARRGRGEEDPFADLGGGEPEPGDVEAGEEDAFA